MFTYNKVFMVSRFAVILIVFFTVDTDLSSTNLKQDYLLKEKENEITFE